MNAETQALASPEPSQWIANPRWDLVVLTLSAALVAVPPLVHSLGKTTAGGVDLLITLLIGGPHMYATFLKTVFEPRFRQIHPALTWAPVVVVPIGVILGAVYAFPWLLTFFFTWASIHVCDQASYIGYLYREKGGAARPWQRLLDFSVVLTSLYSYAMYRHVAGTFRIGETTLWFPALLKHTWFADSFAVFTAALIVAVVTGFVAVRRQARLAEAERDRARLAARKAEQTTAFVVDMLGAADPRVSGRDVTVASVLDTASAKVDKGLAAQPDVKADVLQTLGTTYQGLGLYEPARERLRRSPARHRSG